MANQTPLDVHTNQCDSFSPFHPQARYSLECIYIFVRLSFSSCLFYWVSCRCIDWSLTGRHFGSMWTDYNYEYIIDLLSHSKGNQSTPLSCLIDHQCLQGIHILGFKSISIHCILPTFSFNSRSIYSLCWSAKVFWCFTIASTPSLEVLLLGWYLNMELRGLYSWDEGLAEGLRVVFHFLQLLWRFRFLSYDDFEHKHSSRTFFVYKRIGWWHTELFPSFWRNGTGVSSSWVWFFHSLSNQNDTRHKWLEEQAKSYYIEEITTDKQSSSISATNWLL